MTRVPNHQPKNGKLCHLVNLGEGKTIAIIINKIHRLVNTLTVKKTKKHAVWMIMYVGPFGYDGAAPPIIDRTADDTPSPLLPPGAMYK